ncbi:hypothetical protein [Aeoliella sp.]|uniref:J domain-containing protein n=1 Tax=Aeoliella sp. TaxID=2795800 RepID=UPI003CCC33A9
MPDEIEKPVASAALDATIQRNAEIVKRGRKRRAFLERLGLSLPVTPADVKQAYFEKAKEAHPDHGGDSKDFMALQEAFDEALTFAQRNGKRLPWIGVQMPLYIAQREILRLVASWGGEVEVQQMNWLEETIGEDFTAIADRLVEINLTGCEVGDAELLALADQADGLKYLEVLRLANTNVGDAGVLKVTAVSNLRYLDVRGTAVSGSLRRQLARLPQMNRVEGAGGWFDWLPWR